MPLMSLKTKRYKVNVACELCRRRKVKCDGIRPGMWDCINVLRALMSVTLMRD